MRLVPVIYSIKSPSGKIYVGQSRRPIKRMNDYFRIDCPHQPKILKSLKKYTPSEHEFKIEHKFEHGVRQEVLDYHERFFIRMYELMGIEMLNSSEGGVSGGSWSEETKKRVSEKKKGIPRPYFSGENNPYYGKRHSEETRRIMSEIGKTNKLGTKNGRARAIYQYDLNGNLVKEYETIISAVKETGIKRTTISANLNNRCKSAKGFIWKYKA